MANGPRPQFVDKLFQSQDATLGMELAKLLVRAGIPASYVTSPLGVSRMTVHSWSRGAPIRMKNRTKVEAMMDVLEGDIIKGILPAKNTAAAKRYVEETFPNHSAEK